MLLEIEDARHAADDAAYLRHMGYQISRFLYRPMRNFAFFFPPSSILYEHTLTQEPTLLLDSIVLCELLSCSLNDLVNHESVGRLLLLDGWQPFFYTYSRQRLRSPFFTYRGIEQPFLFFERRDPEVDLPTRARAFSELQAAPYTPKEIKETMPGLYTAAVSLKARIKEGVFQASIAAMKRQCQFDVDALSHHFQFRIAIERRQKERKQALAALAASTAPVAPPTARTSRTSRTAATASPKSRERPKKEPLTKEQAAGIIKRARERFSWCVQSLAFCLPSLANREFVLANDVYEMVLPAGRVVTRPFRRKLEQEFYKLGWVRCVPDYLVGGKNKPYFTFTVKLASELNKLRYRGQPLTHAIFTKRVTRDAPLKPALFTETVQIEVGSQAYEELKHLVVEAFSRRRHYKEVNRVRNLPQADDAYDESEEEA